MSDGGELRDLSELGDVFKGSLEQLEVGQVTVEEEEEEPYSYSPYLAGPEMCLTVEERNNLEFLVQRQVSACKDCMPVSLFQARVSAFLGTLQMDEMLTIFSISRKGRVHLIPVFY